MRKTRFTEAQIFSILKEYDAGKNILDVAREHGVSKATIYNWKAKYGGMELNELKRIKELEEENRKLYENDTLKFINHAEGRIVMTGASPEYQYFLKDHLGNVRVTMTTKEEEETGTATMETANVSAEQGKFIYYNEAVILNSTLFDHTNAGTTYYSTRLNGSTNERRGLAKSLSVMPGDTVRAEVYAKYLDTNSSNWTTVLGDFMAAIANSTAPAGTVIDGGSAGSTGGATAPWGTLLSKGSESGTAPKAYMNYLIFNRDFVLLDGGFVRLSEAGREYGQDGSHEKLEKEIAIKEPGYVYLYLSNDQVALGGSVVEVFFDDFKVTHTKSPIAATDDYYPGGALFNSYTRENSAINKYKYQGKELQTDLGLEFSDFGPRWYDGWTLRTTTHDPHAENYYPWSPYSWAFGNPARFSDPTGMDPEPVSIGTLFSKAVEAVTTFVSYHFGDGNDGSAESAADLGQARSTLQAASVEAQSMKAEMQEAVSQVPVLNVAGEVMSAQQSRTGGEMAEHLVKAAVNLNSIPVKGSPSKGTIYKVPGEATPTGKPYIGRHNKSTPQQTRRSNDGRDRTQAEVIDTYDASDPKQGQYKEQKAIDNNGGVNKLDNKRNEVNTQRQKELDKKYGNN